MHKSLTKNYELFEFGAVQKNANLVDLKKLLKMITIIYLVLAKIGVDTAENEPDVEVSSIKYTCTPYAEPSVRVLEGLQLLVPARHALLVGPQAGFRVHLRLSWQTLEGSFSAVSKPNFSSKYAFESSRRDLHNALLCTALKSKF